MLFMRISMLCLLVSGILSAQPPLPRYEVKRTTGRVVVDGKLDDKSWENAATIELVFPWESQTGAKQKTTAKLLWDDDNLYVGYECEDTDIVAPARATRRSHVPGRRGGDLHQPGSVADRRTTSAWR